MEKRHGAQTQAKSWQFNAGEPNHVTAKHDMLGIGAAKRSP